MENLLDRITANPDIFGGKPIIRGRRLAKYEHIEPHRAHHAPA